MKHNPEETHFKFNKEVASFIESVSFYNEEKARIKKKKTKSSTDVCHRIVMD